MNETIKKSQIHRTSRGQTFNSFALSTRIPIFRSNDTTRYLGGVIVTKVRKMSIQPLFIHFHDDFVDFLLAQI